MRIVHVIPIARGIHKRTLSYFTGSSFSPGSIIFVPLRKKTVPAIVVKEEEASAAKTSIKRSRYALRPIDTRKTQTLLTPSFLHAAEETAHYFATTTGAVLAAVTPALLWNMESVRILTRKKKPVAARQARVSTRPELLLFQARRSERVDCYRSMIRESFAEGASIALCVPTIADGEHLVEKLSRGIEPYLFFLHGQLGKKESQKRWGAALATEHPIAVIATPLFFALPRKDIRTVIIEKESAASYKMQTRPFIDLRVFLERLAGQLHARLVLSGFPLRVETRFCLEAGLCDTLAPLRNKTQQHVKGTIVDMRTEAETAAPGKKEFHVIGKELDEQINSGGRMFIWSARRGLAPVTVCQDCGSVVRSLETGAPVVLCRGTSQNVFVCHTTGAVRSAHECCRICGSWRLVSLGIGIQRLEDEIKKMAPDRSVFLLDSTVAKTHKQASEIAEAFFSTKDGILLGTEMALPYLTSDIPHVAVGSLDALLAHPSWRMSEKIFSILLTLCTRATKSFIVQTRRPDEPLLKLALSGDTAQFYKDEIGLRKKLDYPPFSILIKMTVVGTPARVKREVSMLKDTFKDYNFHTYLPAIRTEKGQCKMHGLLRVPKATWPQVDLADLIVALPPSISVEIDPNQLV